MERIEELNKHIRDGLNQWADIMLMAEADKWDVELNYFPRDIMNVVYIFIHVLSNVGVKNGHIRDEQTAEAYGARLRELVKDMTGHDPVEIAIKLKPNEDDEQGVQEEKE